MEDHVNSRRAKKILSKFQENLHQIDENTTLLVFDQPSFHYVYDTSLGKNTCVPSIGDPSNYQSLKFQASAQYSDEETLYRTEDTIDLVFKVKN